MLRGLCEIGSLGLVETVVVVVVRWWWPPLPFWERREG